MHKVRKKHGGQKIINDKDQNIYEITDPYGLVENVKGLIRYAYLRKLWPDQLKRVAEGKRKDYRGYKCKIIK